MTKTIRKIQQPAALHLAKKRVAAYARVSSGKDAMLHSLSAQVSYYSEYIQRNSNWEFSGVYADEALSGTKDMRPEFQRMLADCRAGEVNMVITKSISRFARNTVTLLETTRELKALGIDVYFEEQNIHTISGEGEMILTLLACVAQEESRATSENCKWRIREQFKNGETANWRFLYGYRIQKGEAFVEPSEAAVVRRIFDEYLSGDGAYCIANRLCSDGIPSYYGGEWTAKRVYAALKNEKYTGNALLQKAYVTDHLTKKKVVNNGELPRYYAEDTHPAIIDMEQFEAVQRRLAAANERTNAKGNHASRYPFSGMICCGQCGSYYRRKTNRGRHYWNCSTYLTKGTAACQAKQIPEDTLIALTNQALGITTFDEDIFKKHISAMCVPSQNRVIFTFTDGSRVETEWKDRSRSESWTEDKRRAVGEQTRARRSE